MSNAIDQTVTTREGQKEEQKAPETPFFDTNGHCPGNPGSGRFIRSGADLFGSSGPDLLQVFGQVAVGGSPGSARLVWSVRICSAARAGSPPCTRSRGGRGPARIGTAGAVGADLFGSSGRISSRRSARWRSMVRRDRRGRCGRCGRCGSARWFGADPFLVLDQEAAEVLPESARLARICSMVSGRISSRCSAWWRPTVRRDRRG